MDFCTGQPLLKESFALLGSSNLGMRPKSGALPLEGKPKTPFWRNFSSEIVSGNRYGLGKLALFGRVSRH